MTNDNRDDPNADQDRNVPEGLTRDDFVPQPSDRSERRDTFFTDFEDDETAEIDDIEASDFGHDYDDDDSDYLTNETPDSDDADELWASSPASASGQPLSGSAGSTDKTRFDDWPLDDQEDDPPPPEEPDLWSTPLPAAGMSRKREDDGEWDDEAEEDDSPDVEEYLEDDDDDDEQRDLALEEDDEFDEDDDAPEDDDACDEDDTEDNPENWGRDYLDESPEEEADESRALPWGLIAVAVLALVLLGAGGYGVMQQRADRDAEIRELRAQLATSANPEEIAAAREAANALEQENQALQAQLSNLELENRRLEDTVSGLAAQLEGQQQAAAELKRNAEQAQKAAAAATRSAPTATAGSGTWFVNFGSYNNRDNAEEWASRLRTDNRRVVVAPAASNGRSLYRVRIIGLESKAAAEGVARQLEQAHDLSKLWVGQE